MTLYGQEQFAKYAAEQKYFRSDMSEGDSTGVCPHALTCATSVIRESVTPYCRAFNPLSISILRTQKLGIVEFTTHGKCNVFPCLSIFFLLVSILESF